jgi:hypothetical protein
VANRKPPKESEESDFNTDVAVAVRKITGSDKVRGEDLLSDPKLKKKFRDIKKRYAVKKS